MCLCWMRSPHNISQRLHHGIKWSGAPRRCKLAAWYRVALFSSPEVAIPQYSVNQPYAVSGPGVVWCEPTLDEQRVIEHKNICAQGVEPNRLKSIYDGLENISVTTRSPSKGNHLSKQPKAAQAEPRNYTGNPRKSHATAMLGSIFGEP